jgi:hypothetical protein
MSEFQFTNAYLSTRYVAIYAQHSDASTMFNFTGISAGISMNVYIIMIFSWCALLLLFALIEYFRPSCEKKTFNWWNIGVAIMPFTKIQAVALQHSQSISRCVAIITASIFVLLCATHYQMLLLSKKCSKTWPKSPSKPDIQHPLTSYLQYYNHNHLYCLTATQ